MTGKSVEQRLAETQERIRQLEARKQALAQQVKQRERKERTRRLIQIGGIMARLGVDTVEKAVAFHRAVESNQRVKVWLSQVTGKETSPAEPS